MTRRSLADRNIRKISKRGASYSMTLPIELVKSLKWREKQKVIVRKVGDKLIIEDWKE